MVESGFFSLEKLTGAPINKVFRLSARSEGKSSKIYLSKLRTQPKPNSLRLLNFAWG